MRRSSLLLCLLAGFLLPKPIQAQISRVQKTSKDCGTATSCQISLPSAVSAADLLVLGVRVGNANSTVAVSDSLGNALTLAKQQVQTPNGDAGAAGFIFYAPNVNGGAETITVAQSISATMRLAIAEYKGAMLTNPLDSTISAQGASAQATAGTVTTSAAGDLVVGVGFSADSVTFSAGPGFTVQATAGNKIALEDGIESAVGPLTVSMGVAPSVRWGALAAAFLAQPAGPPPPTVTSVTVTCNPSTLLAGGLSTCSASVSGTGAYNSAVNWTSSAGSISSSGVLATPATAGAVVATATSVQTPTVSGVFNVTVTVPPPPISVIIAPPSAALVLGQQQTFTATVSNDSANAGVTWALASGDGSITTPTALSVVYMTAKTIATGAAQITATSVTDPTKSASAAITITPDTQPPTVTIPDPPAGSTQTGVFWASAQATDNVGVTSVQWSVDGTATGSPQTAPPPYILYVDTATLTAGSHTLSAAASDAAGNVGTATLAFTVAGQLFDIMLLYDDGTPYTPGGTVAISELLSDGVTTQTDGAPAISPTGEVKFRWTVAPNTVYLILVKDTSGNVLWKTGTQLTPQQVQTQLTYLGSNATVTFAKATGAWAGIQFSINYQ